MHAHSSPFLKPPLAPLLGDLGTGQVAKEIPNGTIGTSICPPNIEEPTHMFIEVL